MCLKSRTTSSAELHAILLLGLRRISNRALEWTVKNRWWQCDLAVILAARQAGKPQILLIRVHRERILMVALSFVCWEGIVSNGLLFFLLEFLQLNIYI